MSAAKNAIKILEKDEVLEEFKQGAFNRALDFDIAKILPLYEELYEKTLNYWKNFYKHNKKISSAMKAKKQLLKT